MSEEIQKSLKRDAEGNLVKTLMNLVLCFDVDENLQDLFHYNEFTASFEYAKDFQWPERTRTIPKGKRIEDEDIVFIQYYLAINKKYEVERPFDKECILYSEILNEIYCELKLLSKYYSLILKEYKNDIEKAFVDNKKIILFKSL